MPTDANWPQTDGHDDELIEAEPEALLLTADDLPGDGWRFEDESDWGGSAGHDRSFVRDEVTLHHAAWGVATVEEAKESIQHWRDTYDSHDEEDHSYERTDHEIGSEGFYVEHGKIDLFFRDANAGGRVMHMRDNGEPEEGDVATTLDIAAAMHRTWRS